MVYDRHTSINFDVGNLGKFKMATIYFVKLSDKCMNISNKRRMFLQTFCKILIAGKGNSIVKQTILSYNGGPEIR